MTYAGLTREQLAALERAATPGPWHACAGTSGVCKCCSIWTRQGDHPVAEVTSGEWGDPGMPYGHVDPEIGKANTALIAAARNALPELLAHIEELEQGREALICKT